jgi:hypothetical protein
MRPTVLSAVRSTAILTPTSFTIERATIGVEIIYRLCLSALYTDGNLGFMFPIHIHRSLAEFSCPCDMAA